MTGFVLILTALILGGVIATVGDRLGTRVGKARLTLFNWRPRKTATFITIVTGGVISASTLTLLFAFSEELRRGVFEYQELQDNLVETRQSLDDLTAQKESLETERDQAQAEELEAKRQLDRINESLQEAEEEQSLTQEQLQAVAERADRLRGEAERLQLERQRLLREQEALVQQRDAVQAQITERDADIATRDQAIAQQEAIISRGEAQLNQLQSQQDFLEEEVRDLERDFLGLRQGSVAITRGQVLAGGLIQVLVPEASQEAIEQLLREANRTALLGIEPGTTDFTQQAIQIPRAEVDRLIQEVSDGREYFVRILSAGNYLTGEERVFVFADLAPNRIIFPEQTVLATTSVNPRTMDVEQIRQRLSLLLATSQFRARSAGIVSDTLEVEDGDLEKFLRFIEQVQSSNAELTVQALTNQPILTIGPLDVTLVAFANGREVFRSS
ncbi:MAG: DUF3084 domain-containing protein [Cyanobacteria bacterium P01_H01_bin.121]